MDAFSHILPEDYLRQVKSFCPDLTTVRRDNNIVLFDTKLHEEIGYYTDVSTEKRIEQLKSIGIDKQAVCSALPSDSWVLRAPLRMKLKLAKAYNDGASKIAEKSKGCLIPVADVPFCCGEEALDELKRAVKDLGMRGIELPSSIEGKPIDLLDFRKMFRAVAYYGVPVLLHPTWPPLDERRNQENEYRFILMLGWEYETSRAIVRIAASGMLDEVPNLKIITHHAGSMIPIFAERIQMVTQRAKEAGEVQALELPMHYFRRMYHDTAIYSASALRASLTVLGADRIVFATDYPQGSGKNFSDLEARMRNTRKMIEETVSNSEDAERILGKNAIEIFGLD